MPLPFGILLLGFSLRLVALDLIQFDGDEAYILGLARAALDTRSLPLTSLPSSGGLSNPPLPVWLTMLPAAISPDPLLIAALWAMLDVLTIALCYRIGRDVAGPAAGVWAALAYASAFWVVLFVRRAKGEALMPFFAALSFVLWFRLGERPHLLLPAAVSTSLLLQTHWGAMTFLPVAAVGVAFALPWLRRRDLLLAGFACMLPWIPYGLWQFQSGFAEVTQAVHLAQDRASTDLQALRYLWLYTSTADFAPFLGLRFGSPFSEPSWSLWLQDIWHAFLALGVIFVSVMIAFALRHRAFDWVARRQFLLLIWLASPFLLLARHPLPIYVHYVLAAIPCAFIVIGIGSAALWRWSQTQHRALVVLLLAVGLAPVVYSVAQTLRLQDWFASGGVSDLNGLPYRVLRQVADEAKAASYSEVILVTDPGDSRALDYLLQGQTLRHSDPATLLLPALGAPTYVIDSARSSAAQQLRSLASTMRLVLYPGAGDGLLVARLSEEEREAGRRLWEPRQWPWHVGASSDDSAILRFAVQATPYNLQPNGVVDVTIVWQVASTPVPKADDGFFFYLENEQRQSLAGQTVSGVVAYERQLGDSALSRYSLTLPPMLPPGRYWLRVGVYDPVAHARLPLHGVSQSLEPEAAVRLGPLKVPMPAPASLPLPAALQPAPLFERKIALVGASLTGNELRLQWRAGSTIGEDLTRFVHLVDNEGRLLWQSDGYPRDGTYPTSIWDGGEVVEEVLHFPSRDGLDESWRLVVGWYRQPGVERLGVTAGPAGQPSDRVEVPIAGLSASP